MSYLIIIGCVMFMTLYILCTGCWKDARIEGSRPPPSAGFTMNMIDAHRALLFAGRQQNERVSYIYIYNFLSTVRVVHVSHFSCHDCLVLPLLL